MSGLKPGRLMWSVIAIEPPGADLGAQRAGGVGEHERPRRRAAASARTGVTHRRRVAALVHVRAALQARRPARRASVPRTSAAGVAGDASGAGSRAARRSGCSTALGSGVGDARRGPSRARCPRAARAAAAARVRIARRRRCVRHPAAHPQDSLGPKASGSSSASVVGAARAPLGVARGAPACRARRTRAGAGGSRRTAGRSSSWRGHHGLGADRALAGGHHRADAPTPPRTGPAGRRRSRRWRRRGSAPVGDAQRRRRPGSSSTARRRCAWRRRRRPSSAVRRRRAAGRSRSRPRGSPSASSSRRRATCSCSRAEVGVGVGDRLELDEATRGRRRRRGGCARSRRAAGAGACRPRRASPSARVERVAQRGRVVDLGAGGRRSCARRRRRGARRR